MTERMVSVPVEPTEDAYTLAARLAADLFSDDYETAHRAASPYDVTIKRRHKAEEVQIVIDLYRAMLTAAPVREEGGAVPDSAWAKFANDFNAMTDAQIEDVSRDEQAKLEEAEDWLEAVATWRAAGSPRCKGEE